MYGMQSIGRSSWLCQALRLSLRATTELIHQKSADQTFAGTLDDYVNDLSQKKALKWEAIRRKRGADSSFPNKRFTNCSPVCDSVQDMTTAELDELFHESLEAYDDAKVLECFDRCIALRKFPSFETVLRVVSVCSQKGQIETICQARDLLRTHAGESLDIHCDFRHFIAEAKWVRGNASEALEVLFEVYTTRQHLRRKLRFMFKFLVHRIVSNKSQASLVLVSKYAKKLVEGHGDYSVLGYVWQSCFVSEWFADQCFALELLQEYPKLVDVVIERIPFVVNASLRNNQVEIVQRLIEVLLEHSLEPQYTGVIRALFDYKFLQNDLRGCLEIIKWSLELNVSLTVVQQERFIQLLLKSKGDSSPEKEVKPFKPPEVPKFNLKF